MKTIKNHFENSITINEDTTLTGILTGSVIITASASFYVHGIINGQITINEGANLIIYGVVEGDIINDGNCQIYGTVKGNLIKRAGMFHIDSKASIHEN